MEDKGIREVFGVSSNRPDISNDSGAFGDEIVLPYDIFRGFVRESSGRDRSPSEALQNECHSLR